MLSTVQTFSEKRHELALTGLGASDAAAVLGIHPFKSQLDVWMGCTGRVEPMEPSEAMDWGNRLESEVLRRYAEDLAAPYAAIGHNRDGKLVAFYPDGTTETADGKWLVFFDTVRNKRTEKPWCLFAHIDGLVINTQTDEIRNLIEAKTTGHWRGQSDDWGDEGTDEVPEEYIVQCHHQAMCLRGYFGSNITFVHVPVLVAGNKFRVYTVPINAKQMDDIETKLVDWWANYVVPDIAPPVTAADNRGLTLLYPEDDGQTVEAAWALSVHADSMGCFRTDMATAKAGKDEAEAVIKAAMGDASEIVGDDWRCTWKQTKASTKIDWKAVVDELRGHIEAGADVWHTDTIDKAIESFTIITPGSRRFLPYGIAKGEK